MQIFVSQLNTRYHDLDALRAFAMLLGVFLHASLSFMPNMWPISDLYQHELVGLFLHTIHGFRMQMFFLICGFFSLMMWRKYGAAGLLKHRFKRVVVPLCLGVLLINPFVFILGYLGVKICGIPVWATEIDIQWFPESGLVEYYKWLTQVPLLHHLWFLHYLFVQIVMFVIVMLLLKKWNLSRFFESKKGFCSLLAFLFLISLWGQSTTWAFGGESRVGIFPWPPLLFYYFAFFSAGVILYWKRSFYAQMLKLWHWFVMLALVFLVTSVLQHDEQTMFTPTFSKSVVAVFYSWSATFAMIGIFHKMIRRPRNWVRYVSDASYWIYLLHLPVVMMFQLELNQWQISPWVKFLIINTATLILLLGTYEIGVRYTFLGALLNGRKYRTSAENEK